jgi:hypothetical protein
MRHASFNFISTLTACLLAVALTHAAATRAASVYRDSVTAIQTAASDRGDIKLSLNADGDLPGMSSVSLRRDGNKVTGGEWTLTVFPPDAGPTASEKGKLMGTVAGGTLGFDDDGALTRAESLELTIQSGTGHYAGVRRGGGTLNLSPRAENHSQLVGTLTLNF